MQLNSNEVKFIIGDSELVGNMPNIPAWQPFDDVIINYLDSVSKLLLKNPAAKQYPDVITFGFWCRKSSIMNIKKQFSSLDNRIGRGVAFHIAPSNVAVNFAYSLVIGLLSGNANIVRLPSKEFEQVDIISNAFKGVLNEDIKPYICLLQYSHNQSITDYLSSISDTRIIWGGDNTIFEIRKSSLKPRAIEITFADRYSLCVINADEYLKVESKTSLARGFYNDTYLTDQNACTSPRVIVWMGDNIEDAQEIFWEELLKIVQDEYRIEPSQVVSKYTALCKQAATYGKAKAENFKNNLIIRVKLETLYDDITELRVNSGYFIEYGAKSLYELLPLLNSKCQTLSYYGISVDKIKQFIMDSRPRGIDRIVPIGKTMDFSLVWDGFDLITSLTRRIEFI